MSGIADQCAMGQVIELLLKDARCLMRSKGGTFSVVVLALLLVVIAAFAFREIGKPNAYYLSLAPAVLWMIFFFAGTVFLNHSFAPEYDHDALLGALVLSSADAGRFFLAKFAVNAVFLTVLQFITTVFYELFFTAGLFPQLGQFMVLSALVATGFAALGTLLSSIACLSPTRELLLPVLLYPLLIPPASAAVSLSRTLFETGVLEYGSFWFVLLAVFAIVSTALGAVLFEFVVSE